jgi:AAA ATPase containing von Willebrand factor type A (vWA) domain
MGTKTVDETGAETGTEAQRDEQTVDVTKSDQAAEAAADDGTAAEDETAEQDEADEADDVLGNGDDSAGTARDTGVGQGAAAVVSAGLGVVSLTGSWVATVAAARETLVGQLRTSSTASVATQVKEVYGDAWATTALIGGLFALAALIVGVVVLVRPAFGAPGKPQAAWIKSVAWAGVSLGVVGLVLAVAKYSDILLGLPSTS